MKLWAQMVVRNEEDRYLEECLHWLEPMVDGVHVYDDQSDDASVAIASCAGAEVTCRPDSASSFTESESRFRADAWLALQRTFNPELGDWVLAIDADEFAVSTTDRPEGSELLRLCDSAPDDIDGFDVTIPEVFGFDPDGRPLIRVDGYWGLIGGLRLVRWTDDTRFQERTLGGGSVPAAVKRRTVADGIVLLHYGYADPAERLARYNRYRGTRGHSRRHVESILQPGQLERWEGKTPAVRVR